MATLVRQVPSHAYASSLGDQIAGVAGERRRLVLRPQVYFRVDKIMATDTADIPGRGTRVLGAYVGNILQRPAPPSSGTLTLFFAQTALGKGGGCAATAGIKHFDVFQKLGHELLGFRFIAAISLVRRAPRRQICVTSVAGGFRVRENKFDIGTH